MDGLVFRNLGLASIIIIAIGLAVLTIKWPLGIHKTFSLHAAASKRLSVYYFLLFAVTLPFVCLMFLYYITPRYDLDALPNMLVLLACGLQVSCTLFPETSGVQRHMHQALSGMSALLLPFILISISTVSGISSGQQALVILAILIMIGIWITTFLYHYRYSLLQQCIYFGVFFMTVMVLSLG